MATLALGFAATQQALSPETLQLLCAALLGLVVILMGPLVALSVYMLTTFFGPISAPGFPISINQATGIIALLSWGFWIARGKISKPHGKFVLLLLVTGLYFALNAVLGEHTPSGLRFARFVVLYLLLGGALLTSLVRPAHWTLWFWMILLTATVISLIGVVEYSIGLNIYPEGRWGVEPLHPYRVDGVSQNAIMFAYNNVWALAPGLFLVLESRRPWTKTIAALCCVALIGTSFLTLNRQTPIILFCMLATGAFLFRSRFARPLAIGLIVVCVLGIPPLAVKMGNRFTNITQLSRDPSYAQRRDKTLVALEMARQNPVFGVGLGSYATLWPRYTTDNLWWMQYRKPAKRFYPDMGYLQMLAESGVIGLGFDLAIMIAAVFLLLRRRKKALAAGSIWIANLCVTLLMMVVQLALKQFLQDVFFFSRSWWLFAMIAAITMHSDEQTDTVPTQPPLEKHA